MNQPPISVISVIPAPAQHGLHEGCHRRAPQEGATVAPLMTSGKAGSGLWPAHAGSIRGPITAIGEIGGEKAFQSVKALTQRGVRSWRRRSVMRLRSSTKTTLGATVSASSGVIQP